MASTLLMLVVLLVRAPVRRAFGAQVAYALWALPVLRLVLPSMPETWHAAATPITRAGETISVYMIAPAAAVATTGTTTAAAAPM
ncbi:M56 family metallopeptidase [Sphingomonas aerolata]|uniref:M56 family metallopeptidase n=1 Tax=Sphingomonas aerolata TaxID=185951 RepID=UPI002FE2D32A